MRNSRESKCVQDRLIFEKKKLGECELRQRNKELEVENEILKKAVLIIERSRTS